MLDQRFNRFEIRAEIGLGGMSRVFQAYDPQFERLVAIKVLPAEYLNDLGFRGRFEREARLIAQLEHEAIVPVYEYGTYEGQPYILMQFMPNGSLADRLAHGPLPPQKASEILIRLASALDYAHQQGVIHRDLKASNVLFDQEDNAFLADFGIALEPETTWQRNVTISGTPAYMSPEQGLREEHIDGRSDIYALGVILFELLTGSLPFEGDMPVSVVLKHIHDAPPSLGAINPDLPAALDPILHRALAKNPEQRYHTADEFVSAFRHALAHPETGALAVEIQEPNTPTQPKVINADSHEERPLSKAETEPPRADRPEFPELKLWRGSTPRRSLSFNKESRFTFALALVTWFGVMLAGVTAAFAWGPQLAPLENLAMVYNDSAVSVTNVSDTKVLFSDVFFQRITERGEVTAVFPAEQWHQANFTSPGLSPGGCYQLLRSGASDLALIPGEAPAKPSSCQDSLGWLLAQDEWWQFWIPDGDDSSFQIIQAGEVIYTCRIAEGACVFYLPEQE